MRTRRQRARRPVATSVDELVAGATQRQAFVSSDGKSGSSFERLEIGGEPHVLKMLHVDDDWISRAIGDVSCWSLEVWASGVLDALPPCIDDTVVGAASGLGRNGWGAALLMHDVSHHLVPAGDAPVALDRHATFLDHLARMSAAFWGWSDDIGLLPPANRWAFFGHEMLETERKRGWPHQVPRLVERGWGRFAERVTREVLDTVETLRREPWVLAEALGTTPWTLLHGDWKFGNLGSWPDGRTILLDWAYPGEGPACHDLAWYLALNRDRLPEPKEEATARFRQALEHQGIETGPWWERQLDLCLLGAVVQFGWEKGLGDRAELDWWAAAARDGARWL